jgi:nicotinamide-nucleotide amidase
MNIEILSIGDELLIGQVVNTNAATIAENLNEEGYKASWISTIGDGEADIKQALEIASKRADVVISTGGLGPTSDDITKEVLIQFFGGELVLDENLFRHVKDYFEKRNRPMLESNRRQAYVPDRAEILHNEIGTAAGLKFQYNNTCFFFLPGVPFEMERLVKNVVIPQIKTHYPQSLRLQKTLMTFGMGESFIAERIAHVENNMPGNVKLAYLPSPRRVRLRLTANGSDRAVAEKELEEQVNKIKAAIPELVFGEDGQELEEVAGDILQEKGFTLATAESCTGGTIARLITSVPGCSAYFTGSVVAYSNAIKENLLQVNSESIREHGAVSREVVEQMAEGVRKLQGSDVAISTSGIAGPDGGTADKPVGTVWIGLSVNGNISSKKMVFGNDRQRNILRSSYYALNMLRLALR